MGLEGSRQEAEVLRWTGEVTPSLEVNGLCVLWWNGY